jgi:hypothetical protein
VPLTECLELLELALEVEALCSSWFGVACWALWYGTSSDLRMAFILKDVLIWLSVLIGGLRLIE